MRPRLGTSPGGFTGDPGGRAIARRLTWAIGLIGIIGLTGFTGCRPQPGSPLEPAGLTQSQADLQASFEQIVFAQGQLVPSGGVIPIVVAPGDRIERIDVEEGQLVEKGQPVGLLAGRALRESELEVAKIELAEGIAKLDAQLAATEAELAVASVGVRTKELQLRETEAALARAQAPGGELELLKEKAAIAADKLTQMRRAAAEPDSRRLVGQTAVRQQELVAQAAEAELESARLEAEAAVQAARLLLEVAEKETKAAQLNIDAAKQATPVKSLKRKVELLEQQLEATSLVSPIAGTVLAIDMDPGEPTSGRPIMRIADLDNMVCLAEVPLALLSSIEVGSLASISGGGLGDSTLKGKVESISRVAGSPRLPSPDPRQLVDYRAAVVVIEVDAADVRQAAQLVNSQVDVAIRVKE
ncbi:HlyD family efflux transporter periplasmic adaptor subunit [Planctomycetaceae bacterium SH139]